MKSSNRVACVGILGMFTAAIALVPSPAAACSCLEASLSRSWHESTDTFTAEVLSKQVIDERVVYTVEVLRPFSGTLNTGDTVDVRSARSEASCGQRLELNRRYLLTADELRSGVFAINSCGYNRPVRDLDKGDWNFLRSRMWFDKESGGLVCADETEPANCAVDPCEVADCRLATTCESNYCGGCNAEFYDGEWNAVCESR